jgi:type VI secretion system protein ImpC
MSPTSPRGRGLSFSIDALPSAGARRSDGDRPFLVLIVADCSARSARGVREPLAGREPKAVDVDRLERVIQGWGARVLTPWLDAAGAPFWLEPRSLDDLHPDRLLALPPLDELVTLRRALDRDPGAAARLEALLAQSGQAAPRAATEGSRSTEVNVSEPGASTPERDAAASRSSSETGQDMLSRLLGGARPAGASASPAPAVSAPVGASPAAASRSAATAKADVQRLISALVGGPGPRPPAPVLDPALAAAADAELGRRLRALLATPALRALEATWRGIEGLCRENPDEERVRFAVLDASFDELTADLQALPALLARHAPGALLVDHRFGTSGPELRALGQLLEQCAAGGTTLLAGAHPHLAGCPDFAEREEPEEDELPLPDEARAAWAEVQARREAGARLGLALPRFILRQPYGRSGEPIEHFPFEEILDDTRHEAFCWGNGAYLLARVLGILHADPDGALHPDGSVSVRELPVVHLEGEEGIRIKPCAEAWLSERALGRLRAAGFSVLHGMRDSDRIRVYL